MSKNKKQSNDDFEAALKSEPQVFDGVAVTILKKAEGGYNIVKVALDSKSLEAGEVTLIDAADNKYEAIEKFKLNVVREGIIT